MHQSPCSQLQSSAYNIAFAIALYVYTGEGNSSNPLKQTLNAIGEKVECVTYDRVSITATMIFILLLLPLLALPLLLLLELPWCGSPEKCRDVDCCCLVAAPFCNVCL